jgi:hypothetical protein
VTDVNSAGVQRRVPKKKDRVVKRMSGDLAELVRDKTLKDVQSGKLKPTLQHGLMAQQMLDKRQERAADRQLAIRLAAMLGGGLTPDSVIVRDVTPRALLRGQVAPEDEGDDGVFDVSDLDAIDD